MDKRVSRLGSQTRDVVKKWGIYKRTTDSEVDLGLAWYATANMPVWSTSIGSLAEASHDLKYMWIIISFDSIKQQEAADLISLLYL